MIGILVIVGLGGLFLFLYTANRNTPAPEGCKDISEQCSGCGIKDCMIRKSKENGGKA